MKIAMLFAFVLGYAGGLTAGYVAARKLIKNNANSQFSKKVGKVFVMLSVVPAIFLGTVIGGTLGGGAGESVSSQLGYGEIGVPIGLGLGLFIVISLTIIAITVTGILLGGALSGQRRRNAP